MLENTLDRIINIVNSKLKEAVEILLVGDSSLAELGINSITFIEIIVAIEAEFEFEFDDEKLLFDAFPTILSFAEYVESKILP